MTKVHSARLVPSERREGIDISTAGAAADRAARRLTLASWLAPSVALDLAHRESMTRAAALALDGFRWAARAVAFGVPQRSAIGRDMMARAHVEREAAWEPFAVEYLKEARATYLSNRKACETLVRGVELGVLCVCRHSRYCHRYIVRTRILTGLGCVDDGERGDEFYQWGNR